MSIESRNAYYMTVAWVSGWSTLDLVVKFAFIFGSFLVTFPVLLRFIDIVDNSFAFTFIAIGILLVIIGELNRARVEELSPYY